MQRSMLILSVAAGVLPAVAAEVPWQFTGDTNRVAVASASATSPAVVAPTASATTQYAGVFDSRGRDMRLSNAGNLKSTPATGGAIIVR